MLRSLFSKRAGTGLLAAFLCTTEFAQAQEAKVTRIDPPNWWTGMEHDTVQLLVYGENLAGVEPLFDPPGPTILRTQLGASPNYLFVDVHIGPGVKADNYRLLFRSLRDEVSTFFPIMDRAPREERHQGFNQDDVIYLIVPDRFSDGNRANNNVNDAKLYQEYDRSVPGAWHGGDIQGVMDHLNYFDELGVTTLWLTPVLENAGKSSYHGYAATDYYRIDPRFGSNSLYAEFVESAHSLGLKVIFDHVNNHCGVDHVWVKNQPTQTWFNGSLEKHDTDGHNLPAVHDPYAAPGELEKMRRFWFVDQMPDLNQQDRYVARYLIQQTLWWIEQSGIDGIREDTYPYSDAEFGVQWVRAILREYPALNITGESWGTTAFTALFQEGCQLPRNFNSELPSVIDFGFMMAMERYLKGQEGLLAIYQRLSEDYFFGDPDNLVSLLGNHDTPRPIFVAGGNAGRYRVALHILLTTRGIPQIFYGEELGMMGGESHVQLRQDFPGGFPDDSRSAFTASGRTDAENAMFTYMQNLLQLRARHPALRHGELRHVRPDWDGGYYAYGRYHESGNLLSVVNGSEKAQEVPYRFLLPLLGNAETRGKGDAVLLRNLRSGQSITFGPGDLLPLNAYQGELYEILR